MPSISSPKEKNTRKNSIPWLVSETRWHKENNKTGVGPRPTTLLKRSVSLILRREAICRPCIKLIAFCFKFYKKAFQLNLSYQTQPSWVGDMAFCGFPDGVGRWFSALGIGIVYRYCTVNNGWKPKIQCTNQKIKKSLLSVLKLRTILIVLTQGQGRSVLKFIEPCRLK